MRLLIFSGFLGSGKTTLVQKMIRAMVAEGNRVVIIENEIGKVGIDQHLLAEHDIKITPLFGGCVCCQISGDLLLAVRRIKADIDPDWIVVEMTGLATLDRIIDLFARYGDPDLPVHTAAVVDASRWDVLVKIAAPLMEHQLRGAQVVLINKTDIQQPSQALLAKAAEVAADAAVFPVVGLQVDAQQLWAQLQEVLL